jgi:flagellin
VQSQGTGTALNTSAQLTTVAAGGTFTLNKVNGIDVSALNGGTGITVTVPATTGTAGAAPTAQQIADSYNTALKTALQGTNAASGYTGPAFSGNELSMTASVAADGTGTTFALQGTGDFTTAESAGGPISSAGLTAGASSTVANANSGQFQVGANQSEKIQIVIGKIDANALHTDTIDLNANPDAAISTLDKALSTVSNQRATLGAYQNRFEHVINNLNVSVENLSASESRIRDTDMAQEMVQYTRNQILTQAGTSMLSQANQASQNVLSLLR